MKAQVDLLKAAPVDATLWALRLLSSTLYIQYATIDDHFLSLILYETNMLLYDDGAELHEY